jgi:hypothetical protein
VDQSIGWVKFDTNETGHSLTDNEDYNNANSPEPNLSFTTYRHEFPEPSFTWDPSVFIIGDEVYFEGQANYYTDTTPSTSPQACTDINCDFAWSTTVGSEISNATNSTTTIIFTQSADGFVILEVKDPDGYTCSNVEEISVDYETPIWKEVKPEE